MRITGFQIRQAAAFLSMAIGMAAASSGAVQHYRCSNEGVGEVQCVGSGCALAETYTPLRVSVGRANVAVCAYSACREGKPDLFARSGDHLIASALLPPPPTVSELAERATIVLDTSDGFATLKWMGFAQPLRCSRD